MNKKNEFSLFFKWKATTGHSCNINYLKHNKQRSNNYLNQLKVKMQNQVYDSNHG